MKLEPADNVKVGQPFSYTEHNIILFHNFQRLFLDPISSVLDSVIYCTALWIFSLEVYLRLACPEGRDETVVPSVSVTLYYYLGSVKANAV